MSPFALGCMAASSVERLSSFLVRCCGLRAIVGWLLSVDIAVILAVVFGGIVVLFRFKATDGFLLISGGLILR